MVKMEKFILKTITTLKKQEIGKCSIQIEESLISLSIISCTLKNFLKHVLNFETLYNYHKYHL